MTKHVFTGMIFFSINQSLPRKGYTVLFKKKKKRQGQLGEQMGWITKASK
jgi:hypothetical protein